MPEISPTRAFARPLSSFESYFAVTSATIWVTDQVVGPLDLDMLRAAWDLVCLSHPVLTARLVPTAGDDESVAGLRGLEIVVPAGPAAAPIGRIDDESPTLGAGGPVARLSVGTDPTRVALACHHAIADGRLVQFWHDELWSYYTELAAGRTPAIRPHPVPLSPEALLGERGVVRTAGPPNRLGHATPTNLPSGRAAPPVRWRQVRLRAADTTALLATARRRGQTVHSLVAGVAGVATRRFLPIEDDRPIDINVVSPVDIRPRLDPPVPVWAGTNILGMANAVVAVHPGSDPADVGAVVTGQLAADLAAGVVHQSFLHMADTVDRPRPLVPRTITTNLGVLAPTPTPPETTITDLRYALRFDWAPLVAMMTAAGHTDHPLLRTSVHMIHTRAGRLCVDFSTSLSEERADRYAAEFTALLLGLTTPG
ncbi:hypothetical protein [Nocardia sp. NPDC051833]|uniref:phthiocerol/phthiodiolone dimycocerosyl transferase family protein n=1 Tax=Nocardia sp. NPDC051833 TaxID=3155674 RepID=UPI0034138BB4